MLYPIHKGLPFYPNLLVLAYTGYYPLNPNYNKKRFLYVLFCWMFMWTGTLWNLTIVLYMSIKNKTSYGITEAMGYLIGNSSLALVCLFFALKHEEWSDLLGSLVDFQKYGKPPKFDEAMKNSTRVGMLFFIGCCCGITGYAVLQLLWEEGCQKQILGRNSCGMLHPTWLPGSYANNKLVKRVMIIYQVLACLSMASFAIIVPLILQATEVILSRADHLKTLIRNVGRTADSELQLKQFLAFVEYHNDIIRLCSKLNQLANYTTGHVGMTFVTVVACFGHHSIQAKSFQSLTYQTSYITSMCFLCHAGQRMQDQMRSIGEVLYASNWNHCSINIQKMIPFVILRCQRSISLDAFPTGQLDYVLLFMVLKTTYSYINLLTQTI